jgi:hypothetical protein
MTEAEWNKLLDASPGDRELRQAYATWLQDEADNAARARFEFWLAEEGKWPTPKPLNQDEKGWAWYYQLEITEPVMHATLGAWALDHMPRVRWLYPTRREAEDVLYQAWEKWFPTQQKEPRTPRRKRK